MPSGKEVRNKGLKTSEVKQCNSSGVELSDYVPQDSEI